MPTSTLNNTAGKVGGQGARLKAPTSPTSLSNSTSLPSVPRIKLSLRPDTPNSQPIASGSGTCSSSQPKRKVGRPRKSDLLFHSQPPRKASSRSKNQYKEINPDNEGDDGDSSDLTPPEDGDVGDDSDLEVTPRKRPVGRPKSGGGGGGGGGDKKGKGKEGVVRKKARTATSTPAVEGNGKGVVGGQAGRQRRRANKLEDSGRRRARDAKFDITEDAFAGSIPAQGAFHIRSFLDSDTASSFGDDESDRHMSPALAALEGMIHESDDDETRGLPEAFAGQEIEDLAYGAAPEDMEMEQEHPGGWMEEDEEDMFISHLSGSEADQQSQSSAHDSNSDMESSSSDSENEDEGQIDEFGLRIPLLDEEVGQVPTEEQPGLVLMENWDGKLVLYQTNPPTRTSSKSRNRSDSRGSRTNGSVAGSTVAPSASDVGDRERELHLMIDPEAVAAEYDEDATSSEEWSGESDEMDGDTTDSMDEEDMPLLDSPAMQELIDQRTRLASPSVADGLLGERLQDGTMEGPAIIVTDADVTMGESSTTIMPPPAAPSPTVPAPPLPSATTPTPSTPGSTVIPVMGTFLPTSTDPAQHAVIDGSGTSTKSPFTHRRRSRKTRGDSVSVSSGGRSIMSRSTTERKRKNSNPTSLILDPFGGPPIIRSISKKARYTSIPGHPKYVQQQRIEEDDGEGTSSTEEDEEGGEFDLEDMLDPEILEQLAQTANVDEEEEDEEQMRHLIRFDRVPVSAYIRRNFGGNPTSVQRRGRSSPIITSSRGLEVLGMMHDAEAQGPTLLGVQARMIVSPLISPVGGGMMERQVDSLHI